jgi:putative OPT family oligopeptide transporter
MFGGELPWTMIWIGAVVGAVTIAIDEVLKKRGSTFRVPVMAAAIGIYLPLDLTVPIFLGGLLAHIVQRVSGTPSGSANEEKIHRQGVLFSAGLITGEALMGILIAIPIVVSGDAATLALPEQFQFGNFVGLLIFAAIGFVLYRVAVAGARHTR